MKLALDDLAVFVAIADAGSLAAAARVLSMTTSTVSRRLAEHEHRVGASLFRRSTRALSLTDEGHRRYALAKPLIDEAMRVRDALERDGAEPTGLVRVTATAAIGQHLLAPVFASFLERHSEVRIEMRLTESRVNLVADGIDLAVRMGPLEDSELLARRLIDVRRVVVASPGHLARVGRPDVPGDLAARDCIVQSAALATWHFANDVDVAVRWRLAAGNVLLARRGALDGCGFALLPDFVVDEDLAAARLVRVLDGHETVPARATLVAPRQRHRSPAAIALSDALVAHYRRRP